LWERSPLLGIGLKHYRVLCADPALEPIGPIEARCYPHPHHVYLEWLTETGLLGLAGFLALIAAWALRIARAVRPARPASERALAACAAAALIVFLWPLATSMSLFVTWNGILFWTAVGWAMAVTRT
jgi:O-antigen ligase